MIKKIKDAIYDFNDVLIVLLIVAAATALIAWRVDVVMAYPEYLAAQEQPEQVADVDFTDVDLTPTEVEDFNTDPEEITTDPAEGEDPTETNPPEVTPPTGDVSFTVPSGSSAAKIADLLKQAGLISSQESFLSVLTDLGLETKLKAGTFTIPAGSSESEIAQIIAR